MRLVNLTAHRVVLYPDGTSPTVAVEPAGSLARVDEHHRGTDDLDTFDGPVPVVDVVQGDVIDGLPAPEPGTVYIVSRLTASRTDRPDVLFPFGEVRDGGGRIIGCRVLARFASTPGE